MLQTLLAGRFQLRVHHDQKVEPVYLLVVDKRGAKLPVSTSDGARKGCSGRPGQYFCRAITTQELAENLTATASIRANMPPPPGDFAERRIELPVVDQTGLTGVYDIDLQWAPPAGTGPGRPGARANFPPRNPAVKANSIFQAFEALGLKLQAAKHTFDILVVDHAERVPVAN